MRLPGRRNATAGSHNYSRCATWSDSEDKLPDRSLDGLGSVWSRFLLMTAGRWGMAEVLDDFNQSFAHPRGFEGGLVQRSLCPHCVKVIKGHHFRVGLFSSALSLLIHMSVTGIRERRIIRRGGCWLP